LVVGLFGGSLVVELVCTCLVGCLIVWKWHFLKSRQLCVEWAHYWYCGIESTERPYLFWSSI